MAGLTTKIRNQLAIIVLFISIFLLYLANPILSAHFPEKGEVLVVVLVAGLLLLSALATVLAEGTIFPSFLVAIFIGLALHDVLLPVTTNPVVMNTIITISAVYILFGGGLEIVFREFRKILTPTVVLASLGLFISVFCLPFMMSFIPMFSAAHITLSVALLLGAVVASTDPAAIIPVLKKLNFRKKEIKNIIVSESALTDVTGALVTFSFLHYVTTNGHFSSFSQGLGALTSYNSLQFLLEEVSVGLAAGLLGSVVLHLFLKRKEHIKETSADVALFIAIPLVAYGLASLFHGSGYLAAFTAGLLVLIHEKAKQTEAFFIHMTDGIAKPLIFIFLGAMVDVEILGQYALVGILAGLIFILIVRPVSVFISLWLFRKKADLCIKDLFFISFIRETGVIPAVLLLQVVATPSLGLGPEFLAIGMWVIVMTLIVLPPLTPWIARKLDVVVKTEA
jgi:NhaP-type Na+/H+ or K+/H+ antiporter